MAKLHLLVNTLKKAVSLKDLLNAYTITEMFILVTIRPIGTRMGFVLGLSGKITSLKWVGIKTVY